MEILVTGPDGLLGSNLVRELLNRNYSVSVLVEVGKNPKTLKGLPIKFFYGNILDPQILNEAFEGKDVVFHCAASTKVYPARNAIVKKVNIEGTQNIIDAALKHSIKRLIYVGTANSFGAGLSLSELGNETSAYASEKYKLDYHDSKYQAQLNILEASKNKKLPAIIVNPTFMMGPFDSGPSSGALIIAIANQKLPGSSPGGKNFVAVKDVVVAMANAVEMGRIGECYILGNENLLYTHAIETISKVVGVKTPKRKIPSALLIFYGTVNSFFAKLFRYTPSVTREVAKISCENQYYCSDKAIKELLLPQTPFATAVKESYEWFIENGYVNKQ